MPPDTHPPNGGAEDVAACRPSAQVVDVDSLHTLYSPEHHEGPDFDALVESIRKHGIQNPLTVSGLGNLVDGYRRWFAAKVLGLKQVPVVVNPAIDTTEKEVAAVLATETRSARNDLDHAKMIRRFMEASGFDQKRAADGLGVSPTLVSSYLSIFDHSAEVQAAVGARKLTRHHLAAVAKLPSERQDALLLKARDEGLSARKLAAVARPPKPKAQPKVIRLVEGRVTVVFPAHMSVGDFRADLAKITGGVADRLRDASKALVMCKDVFGKQPV